MASFHSQPTLPETVAAAPLPPLPEKIGPYKVESLLARGSMSLLYLALHPKTREPIALKVLSPTFVNHPEMVERFMKEADIIALASHPNIVKLYGEGKWEGGLYIAMEFVRGISLTQFLQTQALSLRRSIEILLQVAYALCHLHAHGVIHRDLKPENILITEDGEIKVIDFGIAQLHAEPTATSIVGTLNYLSPEQRHDPTRVSFASDLYSLGVIGYELILGRLSHGTLDLALLPKGLRPILSKALAISPEERYRDSVDLIQDLSAYLRGGEWERDRRGSDQVREFLERLQRASLFLAPMAPPLLPNLEIGIAKLRPFNQSMLSFDCLPLPPSRSLILLAKGEGEVEGPIPLSFLRGVWKTLLKEHKIHKERLELPGFMEELHSYVSAEVGIEKVNIAALRMSLIEDEVAFLSCGIGRLMHKPRDQAARFLGSDNPPLGSVNPSFSETRDTWKSGDLLIFHTLEKTAHGQLFWPSIEATFQDALNDSLFLSAQSLAEAIMRKLERHPAVADLKEPQLLIAIRRIS